MKPETRLSGREFSILWDRTKVNRNQTEVEFARTDRQSKLISRSVIVVVVFVLSTLWNEQDILSYNSPLKVFRLLVSFLGVSLVRRTVTTSSEVQKPGGGSYVRPVFLSV